MLGLAPAGEPMELVYMDHGLPYPGYFNQPSDCILRVYQGGSLYVVVATSNEDGENHGTSITNRAEVVADTVKSQFPKLEFVGEGANAAWVENYPQRGMFEESFDVVSFQKRNGKYANPSWVRIEREQLERLLGQRF